VFQFESARSYEDLRNAMSTLSANFSEWMSSSQQDSLRRAFITWLRAVILPRIREKGIPEAGDLQEVCMLLDERMDQWEQDFKRQGHRDGEAALLLRQLGKRFGELPTWVAQRMREADLEQLDRWGEQLMDAQTLEAVFI
jgi:hypothetical protein